MVLRPIAAIRSSIRRMSLVDTIVSQSGRFVNCLCVLLLTCCGRYPGQGTNPGGYVSSISFNVDPDAGLVPLSWRYGVLNYAAVCFDSNVTSEICFLDKDGVQASLTDGGRGFMFRLDGVDGLATGAYTSSDEAYVDAIVDLMATDGISVSMVGATESLPNGGISGALHFLFSVREPNGILMSRQYRGLATPLTKIEDYVYVLDFMTPLDDKNYIGANGKFVVSKWEIYSDYMWTGR